MTTQHITPEQANKIAIRTMDDHSSSWINAICNAAIQHYIDSQPAPCEHVPETNKTSVDATGSVVVDTWAQQVVVTQCKFPSCQSKEYQQSMMAQLTAELWTGVVVPPGHALVPLKPDDDMLCAGQEAWAIIKPKRNAIEDCTEANAVYLAMLAAAPQAVQSPCDAGAVCLDCQPRNADGSCPGAKPVPKGERDAFEAWMNSEYSVASGVLIERDADGDYKRSQTLCEWDAWKARALLQAQPQRQPLTTEDLIGIMERLGITVAGPASDAIEALARAIEAAHKITGSTE